MVAEMEWPRPPMAGGAFCFYGPAQTRKTLLGRAEKGLSGFICHRVGLFIRYPRLDSPSASRRAKLFEELRKLDDEIEETWSSPPPRNPPTPVQPQDRRGRKTLKRRD